jgi:hypothetical protein
MGRQGVIAVVVGLGLCVGGVSLWGEESLADIARKAKERRAQTERSDPAKVITQDDLKKTTTAAPAPGGQEGEASGSTGTSAAGASTDEPGGVQEYWQERIRSAREAAEAAEKRAADLEKETRPSGARQTDYAAAVADEESRKAKLEEYQAAKREADEARSILSQVEEEARRSGSEPPPRPPEAPKTEGPTVRPPS